MQQITLDEATKDLLALIEAAIKGEEIVITKDNKPVVKLISIDSEPKRLQFGSAKDLITISDDFDEPITDFEDYLQ